MHGPVFLYFSSTGDLWIRLLHGKTTVQWQMSRLCCCPISHGMLHDGDGEMHLVHPLHRVLLHLMRQLQSMHPCACPHGTCGVCCPGFCHCASPLSLAFLKRKAAES